jgi:hypothetical protein
VVDGDDDDDGDDGDGDDGDDDDDDEPGEVLLLGLLATLAPAETPRAKAALVSAPRVVEKRILADRVSLWVGLV